MSVAAGAVGTVRQGVRSWFGRLTGSSPVGKGTGPSCVSSGDLAEETALFSKEWRGCTRTVVSLRAELDQVALGLERFQAASESAFLEMTGLLGRLSARASELVASSAEAARRGAGEETRSATAELEGDLSRLVSNLHGAQVSLKTTHSALSAIDEKVGSLLALEGPFSRITKRLDSLAICMSLEAVRLGDSRSGVEAVVEDVRRLGKQIESRFRSALEKARELRHTASSVRNATGELSARDAGWSTEILGNARSALEGLRRLSDAMGDVGDHAGTAAQEVSAKLSSLVTSLQFHDLTRQRIEHAEAGVRELQVHLSTPETGADPAGWLARAVPPCRLQAAQVDRAREHFDAALVTIGSSLEGVSGVISRLTQEVQDIAKGKRAGQEGLIGRVEAAVEAATAVLRAHVRQEARIATSVGVVGEAVAAMSVCLQDVEGIGADVEVLAVNTFVKSTRAGAEGSALGVLAREIQKLTREVGRFTAQASLLLRSLASESQGLAGGCETALGREAEEAEEILGRLEELVAKIRGLQTELDRTTAQLQSGAETLETDAHAAASRCREQAQVAQGLAEASRRLEAAAHRASSEAGEIDPLQMETLINGAESRYTMEEERSVHRASSAEGDGELSAGERPSGSAEYGDNVELF